MAYDRELAARLRELMLPVPHVTEKAMFGGLAFLVNGHMTVAAASRGQLMLRIDPGHAEDLLTDPAATPFVMRGRELDGWLHITVDEMTDEQLGRWVEEGLAYVRTLPPKGPAR